MLSLIFQLSSLKTVYNSSKSDTKKVILSPNSLYKKSFEADAKKSVEAFKSKFIWYRSWKLTIKKFILTLFHQKDYLEYN